MSKNYDLPGLETSEIPAAITVSTAILICMSVIYSTCYYYIIGEQFQGFMSTTDYILDSIRLIPIFILFIFLGLIILVTIKVKPTPYGTTETMTRTMFLGIEIAIASFILFIIAKLLNLSDLVESLIHIMMIVALIWIMFCVWIFWHQNAQDFSAATSLLLFISVPVIAFVAAQGFQDADKDLARNDELYNLTLVGESPQDVVILRNIENGVIHMDTRKDTEKRYVRFSKSADVLNFRKLVKNGSGDRNSCAWFRFGC